jgi:peptidoglycan hydrolase-like protein with peptidoglycan-binding domain
MYDPKMGIGPQSYDLIVDEETGGMAYYNKLEARTEWPGGASGVTIGIGYDLGYATRAEIADDWSPYLAPQMVKTLQSVAGIHGSAARGASREIHSQVYVPWSTALAVFDKVDVPKWVNITRKALPNTNELPLECMGALVSLSFNRGASYNNAGDRCREMRAIRTHMAMRDFRSIPREFRSMKRLWPAGGGLWKRREHEAVLFEVGLDPTSGFNIAWVQESLNKIADKLTIDVLVGDSSPFPLDVDNRLGPKTKAGVMRFQAYAGLAVDGLPGPLTKKALAKEMAKLEEEPPAPVASLDNGHKVTDDDAEAH